MDKTVRVVKVKLLYPIGLLGFEAEVDGRRLFVRLDEATVKLLVEKGKKTRVRPIFVPKHVVDELIAEKNVEYGEWIEIR